MFFALRTENSWVNDNLASLRSIPNTAIYEWTGKNSEAPELGRETLENLTDNFILIASQLEKHHLVKVMFVWFPSRAVLPCGCIWANLLFSSNLFITSMIRYFFFTKKRKLNLNVITSLCSIFSGRPGADKKLDIDLLLRILVYEIRYCSLKRLVLI